MLRFLYEHMYHFLDQNNTLVPDTGVYVCVCVCKVTACHGGGRMKVV